MSTNGHATHRLTRPLGRPDSSPGARPQGPQRSVFIATPCFGGQVFGTYALSCENLIATLLTNGIPFQRKRIANESLITRARNELVADFLVSPCSHLLFLDADVGFSPADVNALMCCEEDVVCGAYPMKNYAWDQIAEAARAGAAPDKLALAGTSYPSTATLGDGDVHVFERNGHRFLQIVDGATGFMLITRKCLESYIAHYRESIEYVSDCAGSRGKVLHRVFHADIEPRLPDGTPGRYLSEDFWFCRQWQAMGGKVFLALDCKLTHTGFHMWTGDVSSLLEPIRHDTEPAPAAEAIEFEEDDAPQGA